VKDKEKEKEIQKALGTLPPVFVIIDEGFMDSVLEQLSNKFGSDGSTPIYFRPTNDEYAMLASKRPITDEDLDAFHKEREEDED